VWQKPRPRPGAVAQDDKWHARASVRDAASKRAASDDLVSVLLAEIFLDPCGPLQHSASRLIQKKPASRFPAVAIDEPFALIEKFTCPGSIKGAALISHWAEEDLQLPGFEKLKQRALRGSNGFVLGKSRPEQSLRQLGKADDVLAAVALNGYMSGLVCIHREHPAAMIRRGARLT
jgi:hypothetical protein